MCEVKTSNRSSAGTVKPPVTDVTAAFSVPLMRTGGLGKEYRFVDLNWRAPNLEQPHSRIESLQLGGGRIDFALHMGVVSLGIVIAQHAPAILLVVFCTAGLAWCCSSRVRSAAGRWLEMVYRASLTAQAEYEGASAADPHDVRQTDGPRVGRIRICIVDDIDGIRQNLTKLANFEPDFELVGSASDGQMAIDLVRSEQPDVVLMDVYMPVMDGISATRAITAAVPTTKVIVMSVNDSADFRRRASSAGAAAFISKSPPFTWDEAAGLIRRVGRGETKYSEQEGARSSVAARIQGERYAAEVYLRDIAVMETNQGNRLH